MSELRQLAGALQRGIAEGLGVAHDLSGTCCLVLVDDEERAGFTVRLAPGLCVFGELDAPATTTITLARRAARLVIDSKGQFDFRDPTFTRDVQHTGDSLFYRDVLNSLLRPTPEAEACLRRAETKSAGSEEVARLVELERVPAPSEAQLEARIERGIPFVVTKALEPWGSDTIDELVQRHARARVKVAMSPEEESFKSFVARARDRSRPGVYTLGTPMPVEMYRTFPPLYFANRLWPAQLWMGSGVNEATPVTPLHRDTQCGLLGQVYGRKRLALYAPHQAEHLYPRPSYDSYQLCWASPSSPDYERYPRLRQAKGLDVILSPGELLVQPAGWFHAVYSLSDFTMSVSYFLAELKPAAETAQV